MVSALDRGLLYGDGLFDTLRIWKSQPLFWEDHWSRLQRGMKSMALPISEESGAMQHHLQELLDRNAVRDAIARIQVTRGPGGRGYSPPSHPDPTLIITMHAIDNDFPIEPLSWSLNVASCRTGSGLPHQTVKTCNKWLQIAARMEATQAGFQDALILNEKSHVTESSCANLFIIQGQKILTPPLEDGLLEGTTRGLVMEMAKELGITCCERSCKLAELQESEGLFLTLSTHGIIHIKALEEHRWHEPHALIQTLYQSYLRKVRSHHSN